MDAAVDGVPYKFEVKAPDGGDSFVCARNGRDALRPIKTEIADLLLRFKKISGCSLIPVVIRGAVQELSTVSPDELCDGNIVKLGETCRALSELCQTLRASLPTVSLFNPFTAERTEVIADRYVATAKVWGIPETALIEKVGAEVLATVRFLDSLANVYIETPDRLVADLTSLRDIFRGYVLVLVHKDKGYYLMTSAETKITFNRITLGNPRFKVDVMERPAALRRGGQRRRRGQHSPAAGTY
jgi:hypothetical protein